MNRSTRSTHSIWLALFVIGAASVGAEFATAAEKGAPTSDRLLASAAQAEIAGDAATRDAILRNAIQVDPNSRPARWQLGQIEVNGQWQPVEAAQKSAASDPRQREYVALRNGQGDTPQGQLALARWCDKKGLKEEARFHWMSVLSVNPNFEEAFRALDSEWFRGQLLTRDEIARAKEQLRARERPFRGLNSKLAGWQRGLAGELPERITVLEEVRAVDDPKAILAIERVTLKQTTDDMQIVRQRQLSQALLHAIARMSDPIAIQSQIRHTVFSPLESVRASALKQLKQRQMTDYVPILLDNLVAPIESWFGVTTDIDGSVYYTHSLYRAGRLADWSLDAARVTLQRDLQGRQTLVRRDGTQQDLDTDASAQVEMAFVAASSRQQYGAQAVSVEHSLKQLNESARAWNELVYPTLIATTGQELGTDPRAWWNWWDDHNEDYSYDPKPLYDYWYRDVDVNYYAQSETQYEAPPPSPPRRCECFVKGTPVWTKTGRRPIESLRIGDQVLSQDVATGELGYKPVIGTTIRPPSELLNLKTGDEQLVTTQGHPFWVAGAGWKMAKELGEGAVLHGVKSPVRIERVESAANAETFNLVVADFSTYFVGESGVLVHDNSPRRPTLATVPGVATK